MFLHTQIIQKWLTAPKFLRRKAHRGTENPPDPTSCRNAFESEFEIRSEGSFLLQPIVFGCKCHFEIHVHIKGAYRNFFKVLKNYSIYSKKIDPRTGLSVLVRSLILRGPIYRSRSRSSEIWPKTGLGPDSATLALMGLLGYCVRIDKRTGWQR